MYKAVPISKITKIAIVQANCKMTLDQVVITYGCNYAINGGLYNTFTTKPNCWLRIDGRTIKTEKDGYWCYAWNIGPDIKMVHSSEIEKYRNAIACCSLVKDGAKTILKYDKGQKGIRGRTAIGIDKYNNLILYVTKDGTSKAMTPEYLQSYMLGHFNCASAIMLDSGGSSQGYFNGTKFGGNRKVANWILIWTSDPDEKKPIKDINPNPTHVTTPNNLNVRAGAGTTYKKIGSLKKGTEVTIIGYYAGWSKIQYGSQIGYVSSNYLEPIDKSVVWKTVNASILNVRSGPSTKHSKVGTLPQGTKVQLLESGEWCKIKYDGSKTGYVYKSYLK